MGSLNIFGCNLKGLNSPNKRAACLDLLARNNIDLAMFQETHLQRDDVNRLENHQFKVCASSSALNKTKGVIILICKALRITVIDKGDDKDGRVAYVKCIYNERKLAFINIYAPNSYDNVFFTQLNGIFAELSDYELIIGSDMNAILDHKLDKSSKSDSNVQATKALQHLLSDFNLMDVWWLRHPTTKEYTFFSNRHKTFTRIDFIFMSTPLISFVQNIEIKQMTLTDHHAYICQLMISSLSKRATRWRFDLTLLQNQDFCEQFELELTEFLEINRHSVDDARHFWDSIKGFIRNYDSSYSSRLNKAPLKRIGELEASVSDLERSQQMHFSEQTARSLTKIKVELDLLLTQRAEFVLDKNRVNHFFHGNRHQSASSQ